VPAFRAARVEQKIVKVPKHKVIGTLVRPKATVTEIVDLEKDLAIHQQSKKLPLENHPAGAAALLRYRQHGDDGCNLRIANPEQGAGARRFQDHLVAAPSHIGEPRQHENVGIAERRRSWPIV
jgi:hypothetical protein